MERGQHFTWAIIQPSAVETVAHLNSAFATIAAQDIECQQYLALVQELSLCEYAEADERPVWLAFLVQPVGQLIPLPDADAYLPIWPCQLGTREPLHPGFDWPFGDCVLSTDAFFFSPVLVDKDQNPRVLPWHDSIRFKELSLADTDALIYKRIRETEARNRQEQEAAGYGSNFENWVDFSVGSTLLPVQPGNLGFPPTVGISALVSYDVIAGPNGTRNELEQDRKCIKRCYESEVHVRGLDAHCTTGSWLDSISCRRNGRLDGL
ncbi:hypothetical protein B0H19DRAFT_148117 [Mycena capillaripes]|nr:hypothetical protein B0H19DRAFT_148117 [Mycena capillaripes]